MRKKKMNRKMLRWGILGVSIVGGLVLLNRAIYCAWISGGPPTDYPKAWEQQAYLHFGFSGAFIATGIMCFIGLREKFNWKKSITFYLWVLFVCYCLASPWVRKQILIDKCLDSGGKWDDSHFVCRTK